MGKFDLQNPDFYYSDVIGPVVNQVMSQIPSGVYDGEALTFISEYDWEYPIDPDVVFELWDGEIPYFDVEVTIEPEDFEPQHPGWDINAHAGYNSSAGASIEIRVSLRPGLEITPAMVESLNLELVNVIPHEMHHLTQSGNPFQRPNCPATPPSTEVGDYAYFTSACEVPAFLIGFRSEAAHRSAPVESVMTNYLNNYVKVGRLSSEQATDIKKSWMEHDMWIDKKELSEHLLVEKSLTGNSLEGVASQVADEIVDYLLDEDLRQAFATQGALAFTIDLDLPEAVLWLRDIHVRLHPAEDFNTTAAYEFDLDASDAQRQDSDMQFNIYMPTDYENEEIERLRLEIEADARHELEHSGQLTSVLMDTHRKVPDSEIWKSLQRAEDYYTSESEVPAHVASLVMKSKRRPSHGADEVDRELNNIYHTGQTAGYSEEELGVLMNRIREIWQYYLMTRWPEQEWPIEFRPDDER